MKIEDMISANRADCNGCAACANICPKNAITMTRDAEGFSYPKINPELCDKCGRCDATCPTLNFKKNNPADFPLTFVTNVPADKILRHSSSGGVFTALSELILRKGGVVFGAAFDENWRVFHTAARTFDELNKLRGSKYVQSRIGDIYRQVRDALKSTQVLFSGTPCQCAGLRHFLGSDHENLLTVEIICHGTPSPAVWESYIGNIGYAHEVTGVNFRSKRNGWTEYVDINFADRAHIASSGNKNIFSRLSLIGMSNRPSCSACKFKYPDGQSDLTLGDAWGVKDFAPEMFDSRGTSAVIIHTDKGRKFFERMNLRAKRVKFFDAIQKNPRCISSIVADPRRAEFFAEFAAADKFAVMEKYFAQDDAELRKEIGKQNGAAFKAAYRAIVASVRKKFTKNILVVSPLDDGAKAFLIDHFAQTVPNGTLYFLRLNDKGELICRENFSTLDLPIKSEVAALKDFAKKFNIVQVVAGDPMNLNAPAVAEWLKVCGLPVQVLENDSAQEVAEVQDTVTAARKKFTKNILVVSPLDDGAKEFLIDHFAQTVPNGTLYFLRLND
ncbi:MAG: Coenzyme F420 hydrogenase/dehydrogenase, beta subunit C-terminal domain, partial [Quinella sp. 1Q7]|nr:Coenzyme F420 hydrogenase/dehydrogenase, beta subunit C-terminal domain [Quinella sp. 1Q7]